MIGCLQPNGAAAPNVPSQCTVRCLAETVSDEAASPGTARHATVTTASMLSKERPPGMPEAFDTAGRSPARRDSAPGEEQCRVVQQRGDVGKELRAGLTVDDPVVERQRQLRHLPHGDLAVVHPWHVAHRAEAEDGPFTGVD